jgi:hypothetical protein
MSLLRRLLRRHEAMDEWRSGVTAAPRAAPTGHRHAPDADPSDVPPAGRVGFDGRPLPPPPRGGITGLEGGGSPNVPDHYQ